MSATKLQKVFNRFIRLRDTNDQGIGKCISCGRYKRFHQLHAGHFLPVGAYPNVRFNEKNVNAQCVRCNTFEEGSQYAHGKAIDRKWGEGTADLIHVAARTPSKLTKFEYNELIKLYRQKTRELEKEKMFV